MRILLSAFACAPHSGSETGGGWRWATELAKYHEVFVLTDESRRELFTPNACYSENLHIVFYRPFVIRKLPLNSRTAQVLYSVWQYCLLPFARRLQKEHRFDCAIHLTYGVFRHPSFLGFLGIPFVFGPVGGGEEAPWCLIKSFPLKDKLVEIARRLLNLSAKFNPFLWLCLSRANLILVRTDETAQALPFPYQNKAIQYQEIGAPEVPRSIGARNRGSDPRLRVLFAGRLLCWKGVHLALKAVAVARSHGADIDFSVIGSGPKLDWLKHISDQYGLDESCLHWIDRLPQEKLFELYESADCFLFPSLHDSGGNVVLEAISFGLPVVCLDLGGPKTLVNEDCAVVVSTVGRTEDVVIKEMANALIELASNEVKRVKMSLAAIERANEITWEKRVLGAMKLIETHCIHPT